MSDAKHWWESKAWWLIPPDSKHPWRDPLKPREMTDRAWLGFLLDKQVGAIWVADIPRLALCFTLAELSDPLNTRSSGVAEVARKLGWNPRIVNDLRLGMVYPWYIQIYEISTYPEFVNLLQANESHVFDEYAHWRHNNRPVPTHPRYRVRIFNGGRMQPSNRLHPPQLDPVARTHIEAATTYGIAQLATNTPAPKVPVLPGPVDWQKVAQPIFHGTLDTNGTLAKPVSHRDMVRVVMPRTGEAASLAQIRARIRQRYGDAAPSDHAITMAVLHLHRAGALRREDKGTYAATSALWQPPKPSGPKVKGGVTKK